MGILGYAGLMSFAGQSMNAGFSPLVAAGLAALIAEFVVTLSYRRYIQHVTASSSAVLRERSSFIQHYLWVILGMFVPSVLCIVVLLARQSFGGMIFCGFISFFMGAMFWRILFFKVATPLKITPDIAGE